MDRPGEQGQSSGADAHVSSSRSGAEASAAVSCPGIATAGSVAPQGGPLARILATAGIARQAATRYAPAHVERPSAASEPLR